FLPLFAQAAGYKGTPVVFTDDEKKAHLLDIKALTSAAAACLQGDLARHKEFFTKYGISAFYGDQSTFARHTVTGADGKQTFINTTVQEKWAALRALRFPENYVRAFIPATQCTPETCPNMMQPTSCVGLALKCLTKAFTQTGEGAYWQRISDFVEANGETGDSLLTALQQLGWRIYYWTPDTSRLKEWDDQEQKAWPTNPGHAWGYHAYSYLTVVNKQRYYLNVVDDFTTMVNFKTGMPNHIKDVPFFVGIAHLGYHVFPGFRGTIIEGHSSREVTDPQTVQSSPFAPIGNGGGPNGGPGGAQYHSGIVAVPPGY
ncbi:MAG: hypothetical protein ACXVCG_00425, partial [Bdellovibrionota bacterium]